MARKDSCGAAVAAARVRYAAADAEWQAWAARWSMAEGGSSVGSGSERSADSQSPNSRLGSGCSGRSGRVEASLDATKVSTDTRCVCVCVLAHGVFGSLCTVPPRLS